MDLLSEILEGVRLRSYVHSRNEFTAPWGFRVPGMFDGNGEESPPPFGVGVLDSTRPPLAPAGGFYAITAGSCWLEMEAGQPPVSLSPGDVAVLPQGQAYSLRDSLNTKPVPVTQVVSPRHFHDRGGVRYGGGGASTTFICGGFFFENREHHRLLSALPPLIVIRNSDPQRAPWLGDLLSAMAHETQTYEPGAQAVINRLAEVLFVQAVRTHMRRLPESEGSWLRALLDPEIGPALGLIHSRPDHAWTVASLADSVAMSRSAFAARFAAIAGNPPLTYLRQHRMQKAAQLLRDYDDTVKTVGSKVGYDSEAAFNNAFRTVHGTTPSHYRTGRRSS